MDDLLINDKTKRELDNFLARPSHALLLIGPDGSGRLAIAKMLAAELLGVSKLTNSASFQLIEPDEKDTISIDQIRELKSFTKLKSATNRVIVVADADKMGIPAQNSFLKLLEEPPAGTTIILTAPASSLRATIVSRTQQVHIHPVSLARAKQFFKANKAEVEKAYQISGGRLGLMTRLLEIGDDHPLNLAASDARQILTGDRYQRLCQVDGLAKDKDRALAALAMLGQMASAALANVSTDTNARQWQRVLASSYRAETALAGRANTKLVLTNLMLNL